MRIESYTPDREAALIELERESPQGRHIRLEMVRDRLLDRSRVFEDYELFVLCTDDNHLVGVAAAAVTEMEHNGRRIPVGFCYDLRIRPEFRRRGYAKRMGSHVIEQFFEPRGVDRYFLTMKKTNTAVLRSAQSVLDLAYTYPFRYLTLPTSVHIRRPTAGRAVDPRFSVLVSHPDSIPDGWYRTLDGSTGLFQTHRMYRIKVVHVSPVVKVGLRVAEWIKGTAGALPREDEVMSFATLCQWKVPSWETVNRALQESHEAGAGYLIAVCQKRDPVHRMLKSRAINALDYLIVSNFPMHPSDRVGLDIRCL